MEQAPSVRWISAPLGNRQPLPACRQNVTGPSLAGVHQDHAAPRLKCSQLAVSPLTFPPRSSVARTRLPRESWPALTTSTPSGWSTNWTSRRGSRPCFLRMAGGMVTWPLPVIFMQTLSLRLLPKVNAALFLASQQDRRKLGRHQGPEESSGSSELALGRWPSGRGNAKVGRGG